MGNIPHNVTFRKRPLDILHTAWNMNTMRDAIELATQITAAALFLGITCAAVVVIWFIVGGQS